MIVDARPIENSPATLVAGEFLAFAFFELKKCLWLTPIQIMIGGILNSFFGQSKNKLVQRLFKKLMEPIEFSKQLDNRRADKIIESYK